VTPSKAGVVFNPTNQSVSVTGSNMTGVNFTATVIPTYSITGTISPSTLGNGVSVALTGAKTGSATANSSGGYTFTGLANGTYTVTPSKGGVKFTPTNQLVVVNSTNVTNVNFTAQATGNYPDLLDIIPTGQVSIAGTGGNRMFQYTHDTLNGGSGPLEILPIYSTNSGNYLGYQHIYSFQNGGWTLVQTIPVAGAFVFDSAHGHFHFPFAAYGLYAANADGSIGAPVAMSSKTGFCIDDSFIYDSTLPNAGAFGNWGACSDPTSIRGLSIGAVDEYDQTDEGQAISIAGLPDGNYWLRAIVDPFNYLAESDESNNEMDTEVAIKGSSVTVLQSVRPVLAPPPVVTLNSPGAGVVSGTVQLALSSPSTIVEAQFLVDGLPFGNVLTNPPYTMSWDTTTVHGGQHWLAGQVEDGNGRFGTSPVTFVTVNNNSTNPPVIMVTDPAAGATVSAVITLAATAASQSGVPTVQFYVDNVAVGAPVTTAPFNTFWDTETAGPGTHVITATATDPFGLVGNSAPVSVTVDNSHPANPIGIEANVSQDGTGTLTTAPFSTSTTSDLIVAFVGFDGPSGSLQTATVSGGGLIWQLGKRSNMQHGTAEIWVAKATDFLTSAQITAKPLNGSSFHGSLTVLAFTNAAGAGVVGQSSAPSGAPDIFLPGIFTGNWVFAVGNDWDNAVGRTPTNGQVLVHQRLDTGTGDTYWVQCTSGPSTADGLVDIHDSAPTADRWNYAAVEIVATKQ
jgi:hypothetical protein